MAQEAIIVAVALATEWAQDQPCHNHCSCSFGRRVGSMMSYATLIVAVVLVTQWTQDGSKGQRPRCTTKPRKAGTENNSTNE